MKRIKSTTPLSYTDQELVTLIDGGETDRVEFKESFSSEARKKIRAIVCAFANDLPNSGKAGVLFIGIKNDGSTSHTKIDDELLVNLSNMKSDGNILPLPTMLVEKRNLKGFDMAVVTVYPSNAPPVKYDGRMHIRIGPRQGVASAQEEIILNEKRQYLDKPFDISSIPSATIDDLSKGHFENEYLPKAVASDVLEANDRGYEQRLASCKMITSQDDTTPTLLGLLTIGKSPLDFLPGAYIQFLRINGIKLTDDVIDSQDCSGTIVDMLNSAITKLKAHNRIAVDVTTKSQHEEIMDYPIIAIEQLVYNAVLHRNYKGTSSPIKVHWYNDRIEIYSPGEPYGSVNANNFSEPGVSDYRNPNIASVMKDFGYVQKFGRGIAIARDELSRNKNPTPEFEITTHINWILQKR